MRTRSGTRPLANNLTHYFWNTDTRLIYPRAKALISDDAGSRSMPRRGRTCRYDWRLGAGRCLRDCAVGNQTYGILARITRRRRPCLPALRAHRLEQQTIVSRSSYEIGSLGLLARRDKKRFAPTMKRPAAPR